MVVIVPSWPGIPLTELELGTPARGTGKRADGQAAGGIPQTSASNQYEYEQLATSNERFIPFYMNPTFVLDMLSHHIWPSLPSPPK
jgi:hypothetical protein